MKTFKTTILATTFTLLPALPVLAAAGDRQDHSSAVVWAFLGFAALIVIAQLLPALHKTWQTLKASKKRDTEEAPYG